MSKQVLQGMAQTRRAFIGQGAFAFLARRWLCRARARRWRGGYGRADARR